jgi:hypothetical protein
MQREYEVSSVDTKYTPGDGKVYTTGEKFTTAAPLDHEAALVEGGILKVTSGEQKQDCPACVEQKAKRPSKFVSDQELREHYADKHAGLEPPGGGS